MRKGNGSSERGDPHHVSACAIGEGFVDRKHLGAGGSREAPLAMEGIPTGEAYAFHEAPAETV